MLVQLASAHHLGPSDLFEGVFFIIGGFFCRYMGGKFAEMPFDLARMTTERHAQIKRWARIQAQGGKYMIWGGAAIVVLVGLLAI